MNKLAVDIPNLTIALRETIRLEQCEQNNDRQIPKVVGKGPAADPQCDAGPLWPGAD